VVERRDCVIDPTWKKDCETDGAQGSARLTQSVWIDIWNTPPDGRSGAIRFVACVLKAIRDRATRSIDECAGWKSRTAMDSVARRGKVNCEKKAGGN